MKKPIFKRVLFVALMIVFISCKENKEQNSSNQTSVEENVSTDNIQVGGLALYTVRDAMGEDAKTTLKNIRRACTTE